MSRRHRKRLLDVYPRIRHRKVIKVNHDIHIVYGDNACSVYSLANNYIQEPCIPEKYKP